MSYWLAMLVVAVMLPFAVLSEPDKAGTHTLERPPNAPAYVYHVPTIEPVTGISAEDLPPAIEPPLLSPTPEPTPMPTPLSVAPKLTPAVDAQMRAWLTEAGAPEEYIEPMIAIGMCESRGSPEAIGDGGNSRGWLQLWTGWFPDAGYSLDQWTDPVVNAAVGVHVREVRGRFGGVGGWSCADHLGIP